jgi:uncharacterized protein YqhQ
LPIFDGEFYCIEHDGSTLENLTELILKILILIKKITGIAGKNVEIDLTRDTTKIKESFKQGKKEKSLAA